MCFSISSAALFLKSLEVLNYNLLCPGSQSVQRENQYEKGFTAMVPKKQNAPKIQLRP